jgi:hypothetical protein
MISGVNVNERQSDGLKKQFRCQTFKTGSFYLSNRELFTETDGAGDGLPVRTCPPQSRTACVNKTQPQPCACPMVLI